MTLTRLRPFGQRRKTYFYGVAGFVLAAHVVVGGIIYVMPPALDEIAPQLVGVEMKIVDRLLSGEGIETGAVELIENNQGVAEMVEEPLSFEPVWQSQPDPVVPDSEPIGPTISDLAPLIIQFDDEDDKMVVAAEPEASTPPEKKPEAVVVAPQPRKTSSPAPKKSTPTKIRKVTKTRPTITQVKPTPAPPAPVPIPRAVPTNREPERSGLLDRLRDRRERN